MNRFNRPIAPLSRFSAALPFLVIAALLIALYYRIGIKLVVDWYNIADYSHGFLVPFFSLFLLWDKRKQIAATPVQPAWAGLPLVLFGLLFLILGVYGADLFTSRLSFVILLTGLVWTFFGKLILREVIFPILVLLLAIPFPAIVFNQITFPAPTISLANGQHDSAAPWSSRAPGRQCYSASGDEAGGS